MPPRLILASSSPRRSELMSAAGYDFEIVTAPVLETMPPHLTVRETVLLNALRKGAAVAAIQPDDWVIAADTLVALDGRPLGKPADLAEAHRMLASLSGRAHQVFTAVCVERASSRSLEAFVEVSQVHFRAMSEPEITDYCRRVHVLDKAGAYAAQEDPVGLIASIDGSRTNVIGLPMERLGEVLSARGFAPPH